MPSGDRAMISTLWDEAWTQGLWAASWSKSVEGLTPQQAAWNPASAPGVEGTRHSIWQIVEHMIFWRENWLRRIDGGPRPTKEEEATHNFPDIPAVTEEAWAATRVRFRRTHEHIGLALRERGPEADPMAYFLPHDAYHIGQINTIRGMLGLKAIE